MLISKILLIIALGLISLVCCREQQYKPNLIENYSKKNKVPEGGSQKNGCQININRDIKDPQPLFLVPNAKEFIMPDTKGIMNLPTGSSVKFYCSNGFRGKLKELKSAVVECIGKNSFQFKGNFYEFSEFLCSRWNPSIARRTNKSCYKNSRHVEIGFEIDNDFLVLMEVCYDEKREFTYYVHHKLNPSSASYQKKVDRIKFVPGDFFSRNDINKLYGSDNVKQLLEKKLNIDHDKYFDQKSGLFFSRGHLAAKADHIYGSHQLSTFHFINVAPQWQKFNGGNWNIVEDTVRNYAQKKNLHLDCYTGTYGIMSLPNKKGKLTDIYLYYDKNGQGKIPVPKLYYRIVLDQKSRRGLVLIGVNNPHVTQEDLKKDYIICDDISDSIKWMKFKDNTLHSGYSYICDVNDFINVVDHLPKLNVTGLLL